MRTVTHALSGTENSCLMRCAHRQKQSLRRRITLAHSPQFLVSPRSDQFRKRSARLLSTRARGSGAKRGWAARLQTAPSLRNPQHRERLARFQHKDLTSQMAARTGSCSPLPQVFRQGSVGTGMRLHLQGVFQLDFHWRRACGSWSGQLHGTEGRQIECPWYLSFSPARMAAVEHPFDPEPAQRKDR